MYSDISLSTPVKPQRVINEKRTSIQETVSLTGVETGSDAWGKVIPVTFGRTRVPGALIWASNFYKTTNTFQVDTEWRDRYEFNSNTVGAMLLNGQADVALSKGDVLVGQSTTKEEITSSFIDLCYSFGKDGDKRRKRFVDKIRINEIEVFNSKTKFVAPGLGFSIRYGYDERIDPVMAGYENGDLYYPDQTLVIFNKFPTANFGDAIPKSVDVEFGCILYDDTPPPTGDCTLLTRFIAKRRDDKIMIDNESTIEFNFVNPTMVVHHVFEQQPKTLPQTFDGWTVLAQAAVGNGVASIIYKQFTLDDNTAANQRVKTTVKRNGVVIDNVATITEVIELFRNPFDGNFDVWPENGLFGFSEIVQKNGFPEPRPVSGPGYASLGLLQNYPIARWNNYNKVTEQSDTIGDGASTPNGDGGPYVQSLYTINSPCSTII